MKLDPMHRTGTRADLVAELRKDVGYWLFSSNDTKATAAADGASALEAGSESVKVGHTIYTVTGAEAAAD